MHINKNILLLISISAILYACKSDAQQTNLSVNEFEKAIAQKDIQILDVRTPEEYQSGHLKTALQANWNDDKEFKYRIQALDKNIPVYTYCLMGARSDAATKWLIENGFKAFNLSGGIKAWKNSNKPVESSTEVQQITLAEYQTMIPEDKTVLVDISAEWCPPCKKMNPVIDSLVNTFGKQFLLVKIDGGEQNTIINALKIQGFPTFLIYKQGKEIWRKEGIVEMNEFTKQF